MDAIERYLYRMNIKGDNLTESSMIAGKNAINQTFHTSPSYALVKVNGIETEAIITNKTESNKKNIFFRPDATVKMGSYVDYKNRTYLLIDHIDRELDPKGLMAVCNATALIQTEATGELVDTGRKDMFDEPIYEERQPEILNLPCIAETTIVNEDRNNAINLPEDRILITIPFQDFRYDQFEVYGKQYTVKGVDRTGSIDGVGIIKILGEERS